MFLFVENLAGLHIATYAPELAARRLVKIVTPTVRAFAEPGFSAHGWVLTLPVGWIRLLKPLLSVLQFPVIQQDPCGWAFRLGWSKQVLSDGLLTEYLVKRLKAPVKRFHSLASVPNGRSGVVPGCAIIGSNWLEFSSMTEAAYRAHLSFLEREFPDGVYHCHPKERNTLPEEVFGAARVRRPDRPVEALLRAEGVPARIVGVCSSSLLALAAGNAGQVRIELVCLDPAQLDGHQGDAVYTLKRADGEATRITVADLQHFLVQELQQYEVEVRQVQQPLAGAAS